MSMFRAIIGAVIGSVDPNPCPPSGDGYAQPVNSIGGSTGPLVPIAVGTVVPVIGPDGTIKDTLGVVLATVKSGGEEFLPDVTNTDSDGTPVTLPAQTPFVATPCVTPTPTTVNGVESDTPAITVTQAGDPVGTFNPASGNVDIPACPAPLIDIVVYSQGIEVGHYDDFDPNSSDQLNINIAQG